MTLDSLNTDQRRQKSALTEAALQQSEQGLWSECVETNQAILEIDSSDVSAHNRLGKALTKLGRLREALDSYERALAIEPANAIAQRNATRLRDVLATLDSDTVQPSDPLEIRAENFIMDTGRSAVLTLEDLSPVQQTATILPGDTLELRVEGPYLVLYTSSNDQVGLMPPERAHRLIELMNAGNRYSAVVLNASTDGMDVLVRETYRSAETRGKLPFPAVTRQAPEGAMARRAAPTAGLEDDFTTEPDVDEEAEDPDDSQTEPLVEADDTDDEE